MVFYLILLVIAFTCGVLLTPLFAKIAKLNDILMPVVPTQKRRPPVPGLGGAALYFALIATFVATFIFLGTEVPMKDWNLKTEQVLPILIGAALVAFIGLVRDIRGMSLLIKWTFHVLAAVFLMRMGIMFRVPAWQNVIVQVGPYQLEILNILLTIAWVLLITNTLAVLDVLEASATGLSLIAFMGLWTLALLTNSHQMASLTVMMIGILAAFLFFNSKPASIVLGEMGCDFLGFILAGITMVLDYQQVGAVGMLTPVILLFIPLGIIITAFILSYKTHQDTATTARELFCLSWLQKGFQENHILAGLYLAMLLCAMLSVIVLGLFSPKAAWLITGIMSGLAAIFAFARVGKENRACPG